ncbi:hypothetical protein ACLQ24_00405 [Micromonospora sp. DT4]|uniref:hypothetical protein n=1 Tax=Micromonospora sp. DT4 TaxID=3393438 RepID=UPI003CF43FD5
MDHGGLQGRDQEDGQGTRDRDACILVAGKGGSAPRTVEPESSVVRDPEEAAEGGATLRARPAMLTALKLSYPTLMNIVRGSATLVGRV